MDKSEETRIKVDELTPEKIKEISKILEKVLQEKNAGGAKPTLFDLHVSL
jgi:hypothetical protein